MLTSDSKLFQTRVTILHDRPYPLHLRTAGFEGSPREGRDRGGPVEKLHVENEI